MDESRKAFESWLMEEFGYRHDYLEYWRGEGDYKSHPDLRSRWQGWKAAWVASRAAIEIDAPAEPFYPMPKENTPTDHYDYGRQSIISKIRAAGIKVKE
ncbi:hypothetical protein [Enterobacter bugandensis]|uniref:hypothetical protein n=1 Tax=Enterobacter bugandensis TaxID=881260 RepID=UPI002FD61648